MLNFSFAATPSITAHGITQKSSNIYAVFQLTLEVRISMLRPVKFNWNVEWISHDQIKEKKHGGALKIN